MITCGVSKASLEYAVFSSNGIAMASFYDRSLMTVKSVGAALNTDNCLIGRTRVANQGNSFHVFYSPVVYGKEKYYHALAVNQDINHSFFLTKPERAEDDFYNFLMNNYNLPLLREWKCQLFNYSKETYGIEEDFFPVHLGEHAYARKNPFLEGLQLYRVNITEESLKEMVTVLLEKKKIWISKKEQKPLLFSTMDEYFKNYGHTLVENLNRHIKPLMPLNGNISHMVLNNMRLYPQQAAQVNGITRLLRDSSYGILNMGMGTGKTICSASIADGYFIKKYLDSHHKLTLEDVYSDPLLIKYRNIVMCPGHLVKKWASEIKSEIPYAQVTILTELEQLVEIQKNGKERHGKEWYIIGKDFAKLSYQSIPVPTKMKTGRIKVRACKDCHTISTDMKGNEFKCNCGCKEYGLVPLSMFGTGMKCPYCGEILMPNGKLKLTEDDDDATVALMPSDFTNPTARNERCSCCGESLWRPHVATYNSPFTEWYDHANRTSGWHRATHYSNKSHKNKKTVWVHRDYEDDYWASIGEVPLREKREDSKGTRKFAPASYIKNHLKGFFDVFILDEAHLFKGGATAQGNAMQALVSASEKTLALTGTIAGGMATHLFYLLYRLDPRRMQAMGYKFDDEMKFARKYGTVETEFQCMENENANYNTSSKGRQIGSPQVKPGISPLIFSDFLLDKTVFLDLSDMSKFLPPLKEYVISVDAEEELEDSMLLSYKNVIQSLKEHSKRGEGRGVLSSMLQFSLSYPDHPYGVSPIKSPSTGVTLVTPEDYSSLIMNGRMLSKEKTLIKRLKIEQSEGRNAVIYCEFTGSAEQCVTHRLKALVERELHMASNEVVIIESSSPAAAKREEWMHKKAVEGAKIFIVNPRCVETGLDFCWMQDGVIYNYPTLIFYQLGYSLFTVWQASRRAYRLNQRKECRTFYMAYRGTIQQAVIQLIAEKQVATSAIQGKFSTEGLAAMAQGVDVKVKLAQAMSNLDSITGNGLQEMFDVLNQEDTDMSAYGDYVPMMTFYELMGTAVVETSSTDEDVLGSFNFNDFITLFEASDFEEKQNETPTQQEIFEFSLAVEDAPIVKQTAKQKRLAASGQLSLF